MRKRFSMVSVIVLYGATDVLGQPVGRGRRPEADPFGPFNDEVYGAVSKDGVNFQELPGPFSEHASVPEVVELAQLPQFQSNFIATIEVTSFKPSKLPLHSWPFLAGGEGRS
jgi:hypothetical protein